MDIGTLLISIGADLKDLKIALRKAEVHLKDYEKRTKKTTDTIEKDWKRLGLRSDANINKMKKGIINSYNNIRTYSKSTATDIVRAEIAKTNKLERINKEYEKSLKGTLDKTVKAHKVASKKIVKSNQMISNSIRTIGVSIAAYLTAESFFRFGKEVVQTGVRFEALQNAMHAVTGSSKAANTELTFISDTAHDLGLNIRALEDSFKTLAAASMKTKLEGEGARDVFYAVAEASTAMQLTATQSHAALYALQQMMSKGRVQTEELRRQLGEQLPGAFQMAAEAMGMTTLELNKMLELGRVVSEDFLPKFAKVLHERFAKAAIRNAELSRGAFNRLFNAIEQFKRALAGTGVTEFMADLARSVTTKIEEIQKLINMSGKDIGETFDRISAKADNFIKSFDVKTLVEDVEKLSEGIGTVYGSVEGLVGLWDSLPDMLKGGIIIGIIGTVSKVAAVAAGLGYLAKEMKDFAEGVDALQKGYMAPGDFLWGEEDFEASLKKIRDMKDLTDGVIENQAELKAAVNKTEMEIKGLQNKFWNVPLTWGGVKEQKKQLEQLEKNLIDFREKLAQIEMSNIVKNAKTKLQMQRDFTNKEVNAIKIIKQKAMNEAYDMETAMTETVEQFRLIKIEKDIENVLKANKRREKNIINFDAWKLNQLRMFHEADTESRKLYLKGVIDSEEKANERRKSNQERFNAWKMGQLKMFHEADTKSTSAYTQGETDKDDSFENQLKELNKEIAQASFTDLQKQIADVNEEFKKGSDRSKELTALLIKLDVIKKELEKKPKDKLLEDYNSQLKELNKEISQLGMTNLAINIANVNDKFGEGTDKAKELIAKIKELHDATFNYNKEQQKAANAQMFSEADAVSMVSYDKYEKGERYKVDDNRLKLEEQFNEEYNELGKTRFDLEREQLERTKELWEQAGVDKNKINELYSAKSVNIAKAEQMAKLDIYQGLAGGIVQTFQMIAQAGGKQSKAAFMAYKAFSIVEATIAGHKAYTLAMGDTSVPTTFAKQAMATMVLAQTMAKVALIASAQPPSYDSGGISNAKGIYQTGNIQEAHIPIPSGKIPVEIKEKEQKPQEINIINVPDASFIDQWAMSSRGKNIIFNSLGSEPVRLRRLVK